MNQRIQIAPLLSTRTRDTELMDLGMGLDFESWRELYGARVSGVAVDNSRVARLGSWAGDVVRIKPVKSW